MLLLVASAPGKTLNNAVLISPEGDWVRVAGSQSAFADLGRNPSAKPLRTQGGFVRLYFVGPGEFPANRARYYPRQRCIALDWPTYEGMCRAVEPTLIAQFRRSHGWSRSTERQPVLLRLRYVSSTGSTSGLAGLAGSVELALARRGVVSAIPASCYALHASWEGPDASSRPRDIWLCRGGVHADGRLHALGPGAWKWFELNVS